MRPTAPGVGLPAEAGLGPGAGAGAGIGSGSEQSLPAGAGLGAGIGAGAVSLGGIDPGDPNGLQIAGITPMSTVDWPGQLAAVVFCQGCPWACPYCHNHALIPSPAPGMLGPTEFSDLLELLSRRRGLLDGVVFSGGEATRQPQLGPAMAAVKALGFQVGLHTAGPYPRRLADYLQVDLIDWIGLDIKALPENYEAVAGRAKAGQAAWQSLEIVLAASASHNKTLGSFEVRLTIFPDGPRDALEVARRCQQMGVRNFALQRARARGAAPGFQAEGPGWDEQCAAWNAEIATLGFANYEYRA